MKNDSNPKVYFKFKGSDHEVVYSDASFFVNEQGLQINWGVANFGFGSCSISADNECGKLLVHSEHMSKEFVSKILEKLIYESIFTDFENLEKTIQPVKLEEANTLMNFRPQVLKLPFFIENDPNDDNIVQRRWRIKNEKVLNIWFDKREFQKKEYESNSIDLDLHFAEEKSFSLGFVKAEVWSWNIISVR